MSSSVVPQQYVYVLTDDIELAYRHEMKGVFKKRSVLVEYPNTIEMINDGIIRYGERYVGTFDQFLFTQLELPEAFQVFSKTSYDELVRLLDWQNEVAPEKIDFDNMMFMGKKLEKEPLWQKKDVHMASALLTVYPTEGGKREIGPPPTNPGPGGKPFGDFRGRLAFDSALNKIAMLTIQDNEKKRRELSSAVEKFMDSYKGEIPSVSELKQLHKDVMQGKLL